MKQNHGLWDRWNLPDTEITTDGCAMMTTMTTAIKNYSDADDDDINIGGSKQNMKAK